MSIITNELITKLEEYNPHYARVIKEMIELHLAKGNDYATYDPFENFKLTAKLTGQSVGQSILSMVGIKIARLINLSSVDKVNFEPKADTLTDLANYILIFFAYLDATKIQEDPCDIPDEQPETDQPLLNSQGIPM